jgi:hypothetical protein
MLHSSRGNRRALAGALLIVAACSAPNARNASRMPPPPRAEFLLSSADSAFWVSTTSGRVSVRGVPLIVARYAGQWYELFAADDDYSFEDALLLGERLYRRGLANSDSAAVLADTIVPRMARLYAKAHPNERPLDPDDEVRADPSTSATAELDILDVLGPYLSYEYHVDVDSPGSEPWHTTRRGVIDLRSGTGQQLRDLFADSAATRVAREGRNAFSLVRDSLIHAEGRLNDTRRRTAAAIASAQFDDRSFSLSDIDGSPTVTFMVPGRGEGRTGDGVELDPITGPAAPWWAEIRDGRPSTDADGTDRWTRSGYTVIARYDSAGEVATVSLADSTHHEWPLTSMMAPLHRIDWLDRPPISAAERRELTKAFNAAALYDEGARVALWPPRRNLLFTTVHARFQDRPRKPARDVRAHDARRREQPGPRVRWRDPRDDGQNSGDRRVSTQPRERRYSLDRPRRLSRADSPRRPGRHEGEHQLRRQDVDGSGRPR